MNFRVESEFHTELLKHRLWDSLMEVLLLQMGLQMEATASLHDTEDEELQWDARMAAKALISTAVEGVIKLAFPGIHKRGPAE